MFANAIWSLSQKQMSWMYNFFILCMLCKSSCSYWLKIPLPRTLNALQDFYIVPVQMWYMECFITVHKFSSNNLPSSAGLKQKARTGLHHCTSLPTSLHLSRTLKPKQITPVWVAVWYRHERNLYQSLSPCQEDISSPEMEVSVKTCDPISELVTGGGNEHQRPLMVIPVLQDEYINCSTVAICNEVGCVLPDDQGPARGDLRSSYHSYANLMIEANADHYCSWKSASSPAYQPLRNFPRNADFPLLLQILLRDLDASSPVIKSSPLRRLVTHNYEEFPLEEPPPSVFLQSAWELTRVP